MTQTLDTDPQDAAFEALRVAASGTAGSEDDLYDDDELFHAELAELEALGQELEELEPTRPRIPRGGRREPVAAPGGEAAAAVFDGQLLAARYLTERFGGPRVWHLSGNGAQCLVRGWCLARVPYDYVGRDCELLVFRSCGGTYVVADCVRPDDAAFQRGDVDSVDTVEACTDADALADYLDPDNWADDDFIEACATAWDQARASWPGLEEADQIEVIP